MLSAKELVAGSKIVLPAVELVGLPSQRATVIDRQSDGCVVRIVQEDRLRNDASGVTELELIDESEFETW